MELRETLEGKEEEIAQMSEAQVKAELRLARQKQALDSLAFLAVMDSFR